MKKPNPKTIAALRKKADKASADVVELCIDLATKHQMSGRCACPTCKKVIALQRAVERFFAAGGEL